MEEKLDVLNGIMHKQVEAQKDINDNLKEILNGLPSYVSIKKIKNFRQNWCLSYQLQTLVNILYNWIFGSQKIITI